MYLTLLLTSISPSLSTLKLTSQLKDMENFLYNNSSNPNSAHSSPRSRDIDFEHSSWDERLISNNNYKVKLLCSYGGRIHLRPHENQLTYVGGDTKILAVDRHVKFIGFLSKLAVLYGSSDACFKYQLPGEDLDALISVTNDEDLEHMMLEYDRLYRISAKPARLRLFIFPVNTNQESEIYRSDDSKGVGQWYVDVLNSVQNNEPLEGSTPPAEAVEKKSRNPNCLFGLEKGGQPQQPSSPTVMVKKEFQAAAPEERLYVNGESPVKRGDIQRQMHELQRMQISGNNEDYYRQNDPLQPRTALPAHMAPAAGYWQERNEFFPAGANIPPPQQQVYLVQTPSDVYQTPSMRPVTGQVSRAYYGVQGMVPGGVYREQLLNYDSMVQKAPSPIIQLPKVSGGAYAPAMVGLTQPTGVVEGGFTQLDHKAAGRDDYYHFP